jgi:ABC-2 type transport system ATP-binding protein
MRAKRGARPGTGAPTPSTPRAPRPSGETHESIEARKADARRAETSARESRRGIAADPRSVIVARGLTKRYGDFTAVDKLDLEIRAGEVFGLLGPNGAGKTTTVLMLLGLSEPTAGTARVVGLDPARQPLDVKRRVGYLPDNVGFYGNMSGRDNLRYTARLNGLPRDVMERRIDALLADVRLVDAADKRVDTYSRGMRQRLGIADALVKDPTVVILDEPTIAIDPAGVDEILQLLRRLVDERQLTILLSSHILGQVQSICDRVGFFSAGKLVAHGRLEELSRQAGGGLLSFEVGAQGDPADVERVLSGVGTVTAIERDSADARLWVVRARTDIAAELTGALAASGHPVFHLRRRGDDLLEIYRHLVREEGDGRRAA